jgi:hypothetical protein
MALREARRKAGVFLAAKVGISVKREWFRDIGSVTLLTVEVAEPLRDYLGGKLPLTMCYAVATQLDQALATFRPLVRVSDEPRRKSLRLRRTP